MPYTIQLRERNTDDVYTLTCTNGIYSDFHTFTEGTYTENGRSWNATVGTNAGKDRIRLECRSSSEVKIDDVLHESLPAIGLPIQYGGGDLLDMLELGEYDLIPPDQSDERNYPKYFIRLSALPDVGAQTFRRNRQWGLLLSGSVSGDNMSYITSTGYREMYCMPLLLEAVDNQGVSHFAFGEYICGIEKYSANSYNVVVLFQYTNDVNSDNWCEPDQSAGDKGYKPASQRPDWQHKPGNGGRGTGGFKLPQYPTQTITQPGEPDETKASAMASGLIRAYDITPANLTNVGKCLYSSTFLTSLANLAISPMDGIVSLNVFPYIPHVGSSTPITILNHQCTTLDLGIDANGLPLTKQFRTLDFGTVHVPENWGSFLDYSATTIELYLPFIGTVELDTSEAMDADVNVQYTIDYLTGMCVANVHCSRIIEIPSVFNVPHTSQHSYQGNCSIQIPLTAVDYGSMVGSLIGACATGLTNPAAGIAQLSTSFASGGIRPRVTTKGNIVANAGFCSVMYPYIRVSRPITVEPDSYQETVGYPSYINTTLGQCDDLCVCDEIDLRSITGATPGEIERIRQYCLNGVHV